MANDRFYGYKQKKDELTLPNGNINNTLERVNPYEFKKGMDYELTKAGFPSLRESPENEREKVTTKVLKALSKDPGHYSCLISYETETRGLEKKPTFASYKKQFKEAQMQEIDLKKLKEAIDKKVKNLLESKKNLKEGDYNTSDVIDCYNQTGNYPPGVSDQEGDAIIAAWKKKYGDDEFTDPAGGSGLQSHMEEGVENLKESTTLPNKDKIIKGYEEANNGDEDKNYIEKIIDKFSQLANNSDLMDYIKEFGYHELGEDLWYGVNGHSGGFLDRGMEVVGFNDIGYRLSDNAIQAGKEVRGKKDENHGGGVKENHTSSLERVAQQVWGEQDLNKAKEILIQYVEKSKINDHSKSKIIQNAGKITNKRKLDFYVANSLLNFEKLGVKENKINKMTGRDRDEPTRDYSRTSSGMSKWDDPNYREDEDGNQIKPNKVENKKNKMTKDDLKEMIATELADFFKEEDDIDVSVDDGGEGGEEEESVSLLHQIYDMLKDKFEGEEEGEDLEGLEDLEGEEEIDDEGEEEVEEAADVVALQERFSKLANLDRLNG